MNFFSIIGMIALLAIVYGGIVTTITPKEYHLFMDLPAIFLVVGGTLGAASITIQINRITMLLKAFFRRQIKGQRTNYADIVKEVMNIAESFRGGAKVQEIVLNVKDPFFKECLQVLEDNIIKGEEMFDLLEERAKYMFLHYNEDANRFKNLGKFPPAYGLMATVLGMIALLSNLGGADAMKSIGPAMGTCLVATFMGIVLANVFILPIGDSMADHAKEVNLKNKMIIEGMRLIIMKQNPIIVAEKLNSFLLPHERLNWKDAAKK